MWLYQDGWPLSIVTQARAARRAGGRAARQALKAAPPPNEHGRLCFLRALIEKTLQTAARDITLYGQDPECDLDLTDARMHFGTAGAAVHTVDVDAREYRESTLDDLYDAARIVDTLEHIHFFQRPIVARDITSDLDLDVNTLYACWSTNPPECMRVCSVVVLRASSSTTIFLVRF